MFGKNKQPVDTALDKAIKNKYEQTFEANALLRTQTKKVLIKNLALSCYAENTPDWNAARDELAKAKRRLLCTIGTYDNIRNEVKSLMKKEDCERVTTQYWNINSLCTSHEIIENTCEEFYKKG